MSFRRREAALLAFTVVAAIVAIEYGLVFRLFPSYVWHYAPWTLWVIAGLSVALDELIQRGHTTVALVATVTVLAGFGAAIALRPTDVDKSRNQHRAVGEWIDRHSTESHPTAAMVEIGEAGFYSRADIVDYWGLLDKRADDSIRRNDFTWWLSQKPDYFVTDSTPIDLPTMALPEFQREYRYAATLGPLTIYRRIS
ncbi:hypothetical protein A5636_19470 [Mycobacterium asiaticum]|uniref:Uncharacterized protein n=1 Tax=Mycobacterium asiaticum TaxID=1790 RepID=A0A1A3NDJ7_MYCAS|nr:hypothetical protein A5636_19470 [Mycobacterium asiaticum]